MKTCGADVAIVIAYGRILIPEILNAPTKGCINVHASLLPKYRGVAQSTGPSSMVKTPIGVCTMQMDEGMDTEMFYCER